MEEPYPNATGCTRCGTSLLILVDGKESSEFEILRMRRAPRRIERRVVHDIRCDSEDHKRQLMSQQIKRR